MATDELFRDDPTLAACDARIVAIVAVDAGGGLGVELDRTVFYPVGGGQAADAGRLVRKADGAALVIAGARKDAARGAVLHLPAPGAALDGWAVGDAVRAEIDVARRWAHRRLHTATHLLCALLPYPVDGCSITETYARLDFHTAEPIDREALQRGFDGLVAGAHPVRRRWIDDAELDANPQLVRSLRVAPPRGAGRVRVVDVDGVDAQPCGGTHADDTSQLAGIVVTKVEKKSAMTRRVVLGFAPPAPG